METNNIIKDDFLGDLIKKSSPDNPSDIFVERIMDKVQITPEFSFSKKSFYLYLWSALPVFLLVTIILLFLLTSDMPFSKYFPGKDYYSQTLIPYLLSLSNSFKELVISKYFSFAFIVIVAAGVLVVIESILSTKTKDFFLSKGL